VSAAASRGRRAVGVLIAFSPVLLLAGSLLAAVRGRTTDNQTIGVVIAGVALGIGALNFYLSALRERVHRRFHGSLDRYRYVSGLPLLGTALVIISTLVAYGSGVCAALGLVTMAIDTGGSVWFVVATWNDASLWDPPT
jgi:hypothetical protein